MSDELSLPFRPEHDEEMYFSWPMIYCSVTWAPLYKRLPGTRPQSDISDIHDPKLSQAQRTIDYGTAGFAEHYFICNGKHNPTPVFAFAFALVEFPSKKTPREEAETLQQAADEHLQQSFNIHFSNNGDPYQEDQESCGSRGPSSCSLSHALPGRRDLTTVIYCPLCFTTKDLIRRNKCWHCSISLLVIFR